MPPQIERLERSPAGFPVPYVAEWSGEVPGEVEDEVYPFPEGVPVMVDQPYTDRGSPILGRMNVGRQRECMLDRLCQTCSRSLPDPPWLLIGGRVGRAREAWFSEPPICRSCALYALKVCPGLTHAQGPRHDVRVYVVASMQLAVSLSNPMMGDELIPWPGPLLEEVALSFQEDGPMPYVLTFVKASPTDYEEVTVDEFMRRHGAG